MPHTSELPGMLGSVKPLMRPRIVGVIKCVADDLPGLATIVRALHGLTEPAARLGRVDPVRIDWRTLEVIHLPTRKLRLGDDPFLAMLIRLADECPLDRSDQNSNS